MRQSTNSAIGGAAEVKRLTQTSDRLSFLTSTHADNTFGHERIYRQMPSKTPTRTTSKQSPMPLDQQSPVNQPEFGEESSVQEVGATGDEAGEEGAAAAHDEIEEEVDPVELVPATGPLIVQVFVTQYLTNHGCGMIRWVRSPFLFPTVTFVSFRLKNLHDIPLSRRAQSYSDEPLSTTSIQFSCRFLYPIA